MGKKLGLSAHDVAELILEKQFVTVFGADNVSVEERISNGRRPDLVITTDDYRIAVEIGNTSAEKISEYSALPEFGEVWWYTRTAQLVARIPVNENQQLLYDKEIVNNIELLRDAQQDLIMVRNAYDDTKRSMTKLQKKRHELLCFTDPKRSRFLCPLCLRVESLQNMTCYNSGTSYGYYACEDCGKTNYLREVFQDSVLYNGSESLRTLRYHPMRDLWQIVTKYTISAKKRFGSRFCFDDLEKIFNWSMAKTVQACGKIDLSQ